MSATVKGCPALGGGEDSHGVEGLLGAAFKVEGNVLMPYEPCGQRPLNECPFPLGMADLLDFQEAGRNLQ